MYAAWAARLYEHIQLVVDPGPEGKLEGKPETDGVPLPRGLLSAGPRYREMLQAVRA